MFPVRWCSRIIGASAGLATALVAYTIRAAGWSVFLKIAMGLEGYRLRIPLIEQSPSYISAKFVKYENMPVGAERRALKTRSAWIEGHIEDAKTFSNLVISAADISLLLHKIEADRTLVHAAYYTDDQCIARIADWIASEDGSRALA